MPLAVLGLPVLLALTPAEPDVWRPRGAPRMTPIFRVTYTEQGTPYVDETYFVDVESLRRLCADPGTRATPLEVLRKGLVWSSVRMHFLVDISGPRRRRGVERNLRECWPGAAYGPDLPEVAGYLAWQGRELNLGDRVEYLFAPGRPLQIRFNGGKARAFRNPALVQAVRNIEYSDDPMDPGAMKGLEEALARALR